MRFCSRCVTPDTRPAVELDAVAVCNMCRAAETKHRRVDWDAKEQELRAILDQYRGKGAGRWDCLIPASGGKDSTWQYLTMKRYGMRPLVFHFITCPTTELGQKNFDNFVNLGVDVVEHRPNPAIYRRLMLAALRKTGDQCLFCQFGIFAGAVRVAINYGVPLIVFSEGGSEFGVKEGKYYDSGDLSYIDHGVKPGDFVEEGISPEDLSFFVYPTRDEIERAGIRQICLGNYLKYDLPSLLELVTAHGFTAHDGPWLGTYTNHSDLDCPFYGVHDYRMYLKYGYGRTTADASKDIRDGVLSREEAVRLVALYDGKYDRPHERHYFKTFLDYVQISEAEFHAVAERFRDPVVWKRDGDHWQKAARLAD